MLVVWALYTVVKVLNPRGSSRDGSRMLPTVRHTFVTWTHYCYLNSYPIINLTVIINVTHNE